MWAFVIIMVISGISQVSCEANYWNVLEPLLKNSPEEGMNYVRSLSKEELLILGRQGCQAISEVPKPNSEHWFGGSGMVVSLVMRAYIEKNGNRLNGEIFANILKDKDEPFLWREAIANWLGEREDRPENNLNTFFTPQDQDKLLDALESVFVDKSENPRIRAWYCSELTFRLREEYKSISQKDPDRDKSIRERIRRNRANFLKIAEDPTEDGEVLEEAISCLGTSYEINPSEKEEIEKRLLAIFSNRKSYSPKVQVRLARRLLGMGHMELLQEVQKMYEETEDAKVKEEIEDSVRGLLRDAVEKKDEAKEKKIREVFDKMGEPSEFGKWIKGKQ